MQMQQNADNCFDVCALPQVSLNNILYELTIMVNAIDEIGTKGEKKLPQFIRGSNEAWIKSLLNLSFSTAYRKSPSNLPLEWWRQFARQCSVAGYLDRKVDCGTFQGQQAGVFFYYEVAQKGRDAIANKKEVLLPPIAKFNLATPGTPKSFRGLSKGKEMEKKKCVGRSSNPLSVAKELIKSPDKLFQKSNISFQVFQSTHRETLYSTVKTLATCLSM